MPRLFVALRPPAPVRDLLLDAMDGVPGARWQDDEQLHLTLRFIGEVSMAQAEDIAIALSGVAAPIPTMKIAGVGSFATRGRVHALWAALVPTEPLIALHRKVDRALSAVGVEPDRRAFVPHITLARLARSAGGHPAVAHWLADHARLAGPTFSPDRFILYESMIGRAGAHYEARAAWPLLQPAVNTPQAIRSPDAPEGSVR